MCATSSSPAPADVERALNVLDGMCRMVDAVARSAGLREEHFRWHERVQRMQAQKQRAELALALVEGPMEDLLDRNLQVCEQRHRLLACILVEAALSEQDDQSGGYDMQRLQCDLLEFLKIGALRARSDSALTEIARFIDRSVDGVEEATATRLGMLVSFWSSLSLCLWLQKHHAAGQ